MRFLIYGRELRAGGGRAVGVGLIRALARGRWDHEITALVPDDDDYAAIDGAGIRIAPGPAPGGGAHLGAHRRLRQELVANPPDALFMLGNVGLAGAPCPQAVYIHNPWAVYPDSPAWKRCTTRDFLYRRLRNVFITRGLRHADVVAAQTPVMAERLQRLFHVPPERLFLLPNSVTPVRSEGIGDSATAERMRSTGHPLRALCLARYYTHKNVEVLLAVADRLVASGRTDVGLFVTVEASQGSGAARFLRELARNGRDRVLHNLGQIPMTHVRSCWGAAHALLLPTLLESFTNTYVDAMEAGVPIITSDLDFARTVCGAAACYVNPTAADQIVSALHTLETEPEVWQRRIACGRQRFAEFAVDWDVIAGGVVDMLACVARRESVAHLQGDLWPRSPVAVAAA
jgi:glycosyltransferase involved in cell wall biosynthesis